MLFFIRYQNREYRVRVETRREETFVQVDDEPEMARDLLFYGNDCSLIDGERVFFANVTGKKNEYIIWRPESPLHLNVESEYRRIVNILRGQNVGNENNVYAKMPGKIVKILIKTGDTVEAGNSVVIMEAMKMENEIRAAVSGTIANICVKEGQAVETGTLLVEIS